MSFDSFRADLVSRLFPKLPGEQLQTVLSVVDEMASVWDFSPHTTAIITSGGIPDAVRLYIASKSVENVSRGTLENYLSTLKAFFSVVRHPVDEVTSSDVRLWLAWYKQQNNVRNVTLEQKRVMLNSFFAWCVDEDLIRRNPVRQIKPIRCEDPERLPMTPLELEKVRKACRTLREKAIVDFLYSTAARVSEFSALDIADVDFVEHTVRIRCRMCLHLAAGLPFSSIPTVPRYTVRPSSQVISILALFTSMPTSCLHHSCFQSPFPIMYSSSR